MQGFGAMFAHEGGWDEILLVSAPIVVIIALLAVAKRRVDSAADRHADTAIGTETSVGTDDVGADGT